VLVVAVVGTIGFRTLTAAQFGTGSQPTAAPTTSTIASGDTLLDAPLVAGPDAASAQERLQRWLEPGTTATLHVALGDGKMDLGADQVVPLLAGGADQTPLSLNDSAVRTLVKSLASELDQAGRDARFAWEGGAMRVLQESQEHRVVDQAGAARAIASALLAGGGEVTLPGTVVPPAVSSANPKALGIEGVLERGSTPIGGASPEKRYNVTLAAERLNGVVVPPGGTFSFNKELGPTTLAAGFHWGFGIASSDEGVQTVPSVAGGICQVATTLFQPVYWAGFPVGTRYSHLYWIPSYASRGVVGLDVTVDEDAGLDFTWTNPTDGYVQIQSAVDDDGIYFGLYGKKLDWDVAVSPAKITNPRPADPEPMARPEPQLEWGRVLRVESATDGFDVAVTRTVDRNDGKGPQVLTLNTSYEPARTVTLLGTDGMPQGTDLDAALARIAPPAKTPTVDPSPGPVGSPSPTAPPGIAVGTPAPTEAPLSPSSNATTTPAAATATAVRTAAATPPPAATASATLAPKTTTPAATSQSAGTAQATAKASPTVVATPEKEATATPRPAASPTPEQKATTAATSTSVARTPTTVPTNATP
jgi:vancomycin resistance protein YoaR